ncbi:hypothetical protein M404DRAFT_1009204, partial [Pisolithus tinctorius Marx 270]
CRGGPCRLRKISRPSPCKGNLFTKKCKGSAWLDGNIILVCERRKPFATFKS